MAVGPSKLLLDFDREVSEFEMQIDKTLSSKTLRI